MSDRMPQSVFPGADEKTPSLAQYFSWINNTNEGATEEQTLANLAFFEWLHEAYGMRLDIYAFDAGAIDGCGFYGSTKSARFTRQFPNGFGPLAEAAARFGCRLGIWGGPDGFGDTEAQARERIETLASLCRDHRFQLFKFDAVCGPLRPEKVKHFVTMMTECRKYCPDLILLNHRLELGEGLPHATTFLWEGQETYIDVHSANDLPAPHNRAGVLNRGLPPGLKRLTEDHGVCLSSCLDYWDDDLILQAFSRNLILAPELYGNPWLLRDEEFPRLARIYNLHRRYREILVEGKVLPEKQYGLHAVSRGDGRIRFLALRNLTWQPIRIPVTLDESLGLAKAAKVELRRFHPLETVIGDYAWGSTVEVQVDPFRACLVMAHTEAVAEIGICGVEGEIIKDKPAEDAKLLLRGLPGTTATVKFDARDFAAAELDGQPADGLLHDSGMVVTFAGKPLHEHWHRQLGELCRVEVPADAVALYEATCFAADNNALEVRELKRSGPTRHPAVQRAREALFMQETFRRRGLWDRNLFDDDPDTFFAVSRRYGEVRVRRAAFRLDLGDAIRLDQLILETGGDYNLQPLRNHEAVRGWVSTDLQSWTPVQGFAEEDIRFAIDAAKPVRYFRMSASPDRINKVRAYFQGRPLVRTHWRASNLFAMDFKAAAAWQATVTVNEIHPGSYLAVPIYGLHVPEAIYAAARCGGNYVGAARRAPSYPSNTWEGKVRLGKNQTCFIPLSKEMEGKPIEVCLLGLETCGAKDITAQVWVTAYPAPHASRTVVLRRKA